MQNEHGLCEGNVLETIHGSKITRICECQCHDNMYQLARRFQAPYKEPVIIHIILGPYFDITHL